MSLSCGFGLGGTTTAADFAGAFHALFGDGVTEYGTQFNLLINGFSVTLYSGYAMAAGYWLENDEPTQIMLGASGNRDDRTDALTVRVNYGERKAELAVLKDIDAATIKADPTLIRDGDGYSIILYLISVRRGVSTLTPADVEDVRGDTALCGHIMPLSRIAGSVLYIYNFLTSGIDERVDAIVAQSNALIAKAAAQILALEKAAEKAGGIPEIGELTQCRREPSPADEWVLCNGNPVPARFPALRALLEGTLPDICTTYDRYRTYIYGGEPQAVTVFDGFAPKDATALVTADEKIYQVAR